MIMLFNFEVEIAKDKPFTLSDLELQESLSIVANMYPHHSFLGS